MSLLKCPKCGELFSDTYTTCPFCAEDEELHSDGRVKNNNRRVGGGRKKLSVGLPFIVIGLVLVLGLVAYTMFGSQIADLFGDKETPSIQQTEVVRLSQTDISLTEGKKILLSATGAEKITFSSSNEAVATVNDDGTVEAVAPGEAIITAESVDSSAICQVTVTEAVVDVPPQVSGGTLTLQSIYGSSGDISIGVGELAPMEVTGTDEQVKWSIDSAEVATVNEHGEVTGVSAGTAVLTATVQGQTLECTIRVG